MRSLPSIVDADVAGRTVLVRADLNVPVKSGTVTDPTRIARFAPTVRALRDRGAAVVVMSHLGRPTGEFTPEHSLRPVAEALARALRTPVEFVPDCVGATAEARTGRLPKRGVALLENLRFHRGEERNERNFAVRLSVNGDLYVNDAFSAAHRAHASTHAIAGILPAYAGPTLLAEIAALERVLDRPERPVAALVGGAKVSTKIGILKFLLPKVDVLVIGGGMANTFLAAKGHAVGRSLYEPEALGAALDVLSLAAIHGCEVLLPEDMVVARTLAAGAGHGVVPAHAIPDDAMALDIGPATLARLEGALAACRTLLWNGPVGAFEVEPFGEGTFALARAAAELTRTGRLVTVAGGGDTAAALNAAGVADRFTYVSTAGGAFLEWLEGKELPGIAALRAERRIMEVV